MPAMIKVCAVEGRMFPDAPPKRGYVGYREAKADESADHEIPSSVKGVPAPKRFVRCGVVEVPDTAYYRRGIGRGDIQRAEAAPEEKPAKRAIKSEV